MTKDRVLSAPKADADLLQWIQKNKGKLPVKAEELLIARV
jgi:hypothetical protein